MCPRLLLTTLLFNRIIKDNDGTISHGSVVTYPREPEDQDYVERIVFPSKAPAEVETKEYTDDDWAFIVKMALKSLGTDPTLSGKVLFCVADLSLMLNQNDRKFRLPKTMSCALWGSPQRISEILVRYATSHMQFNSVTSILAYAPQLHRPLLTRSLDASSGEYLLTQTMNPSVSLIL